MMQKPADLKNKFNQKLFVLQTLKQTRTKKSFTILVSGALAVTSTLEIV
jgi:hypothetical protein